MTGGRKLIRSGGLFFILILILFFNRTAWSLPNKNQYSEEIVGFTLIGKRMSQRLVVPDLSALVFPGNRRFLPLRRFLNILETEKKEENGVISFTPDGSTGYILNIHKKELRGGEGLKTIDLVTEISGLTGEEEVYLPMELISEIFNINLTWEEEGFEFVGRTNRKLKIWTSSGLSLLGIKNMDFQQNLPELFPPAYPNNLSIDLMEVRFRSGIAAENNFLTKSGGVDRLEQSLWGNLLGGNFKLHFRENDLKKRNLVNEKEEKLKVTLDRAEWSYRTDRAEFNVGDSNLGLDNLTLPFLKLSGWRFQGTAGNQGRTSEDGRRARFSNNIILPRIFEGYAPRGSKVELMINDRLVETQEVISDNNSPVGMGTYRFEDIFLPPGGLSDIQIIITEENGFKTYSQKHITENNLLLSPGRLIYLGGIGTNREVEDWAGHGIIGAVRTVYGVTDNFTWGGSLGYQKGFVRDVFVDPFDRNYLPLPESSLNLGNQMIYQPSPFIGFENNFSFSKINIKEEKGSLSDTALRLKGNLFPLKDLTLNANFLRYGPNFFDGQDIKLHDRQGYFLRSNWRINPKWMFDGGFGRVHDNLSGKLPEKLTVDFQNFRIISRAITQSTLNFGADILTPDNDGPKVLYYVKLLVHPFNDLYFDSSVATGDFLTLSQRPDFFSGLKIPGMAANKEPGKTAMLKKSLNRDNEIGLAFQESLNRSRGTFLYAFRPLEKYPIRFRTEAGWDLKNRDPYWEIRSEYLFNKTGKKYLDFMVRQDQREMMLLFNLNFVELFSFNKTQVVRLDDRYIIPESGGVQGKVFLDVNANGLLEDNETGIDNIKVVSGQQSSFTDKDGYYILPGVYNIRKLKVYLDMNSVPAVFSPTNGTRTAYINPGNLTEVNLGLLPLNTITGVVLQKTKEGEEKPIAGIRLFLTRKNEENVLADSFTAKDGSYYLGEIKPGQYYLHVDPESLPAKSFLETDREEINIAPKTEAQEIILPPFLLN